MINHSGFIFPDPRVTTVTGTSYQYSLTVDLVNNLTGNGMITVGGQTIWGPGLDVGAFTGTIIADDSTGLVFNFLSPYAGRAEFDAVSIRQVIETPLPAACWLFGTGPLGLIGVSRRSRKHVAPG